MSHTVLMVGRDGVIRCEISSNQTNNLHSVIQLINSRGEQLAVTNSSGTLTYSFNPFRFADAGEYKCVVTVTSPDNPGFSPSMLQQNFTLELPPSKSVVFMYTQRLRMLLYIIIYITQRYEHLLKGQKPVGSSQLCIQRIVKFMPFTLLLQRPHFILQLPKSLFQQLQRHP